MQDFVDSCFEKWLAEGDPFRFWCLPDTDIKMKIFQKNNEIHWAVLGRHIDEAFACIDSIKEMVLQKSNYEMFPRRFDCLRFIRLFGTSDLGVKDQWFLHGSNSFVYGNIQMLVTVDFINPNVFYNGTISLPIRVNTTWTLSDLHDAVLKWQTYNPDYTVTDFFNYHIRLGLTAKLSDFKHELRSFDNQLLIKGIAYHKSYFN
jgi:hypothetical protein